MNANVAFGAGRNGLGIRVRKETVAVATIVASSIGAVMACVVDVDTIMYLCAVIGLWGAMSLDRGRDTDINETEKGGEI